MTLPVPPRVTVGGPASIADDRSQGHLKWWLIAAVVLVAGILRGSILFGTALMPGTNGAYYLVQTRSLLSRGALGIPDLPLAFHLQASLARAVQWVSGRDIESCILFSVKLADSILPALVALPVSLLVSRWTKVAGAPTAIALAAAALATMNAPVLNMAGNLEKNSLGLLWLSMLLLFIHMWMTRPTLANAAGVLCFWGLAAVTHIGVFGASVTFGVMAIVICLAVSRGRAWLALWPLLFAAVGVGALAAGVVLWKFDAQRVQRLAEALIHPADYLIGGQGAGPAAPMPGLGGATFLPSMMQAGPSLAFAFTSIAALMTCWRKRAVLPEADVCVAGACAAGVLLMTGPWVYGDKACRFYLIAITPALMAGAFAIIHCGHQRLRVGILVAVAACMIGPSIVILCVGGKPIISEEDLRELRSLAPLVAPPDKTLIVARHGMEWWTAWALHTRIAQSRALRIEDWRNFDAVFFLRSKSNPRLLSGGDRSATHQPPAPPPRRDRSGTLNPMEEPETPAGAEIVHDGEMFILSRVSVPPDFVRARP